ncbi:MAG: hypothetical protein U0105_09255 [Candidatus Obscuribacterales bacterium]
MTNEPQQEPDEETPVVPAKPKADAFGPEFRGPSLLAEHSLFILLGLGFVGFYIAWGLSAGTLQAAISQAYSKVQAVLHLN